MFYKGPKIWSYFSAKCNPYIDSLKNYLEKHFSKPLKFCLKHANFKTISVILFCTYVGGAAISILCRYSLLIYTLVYISLGMIALASITAEKIFYKMMKDMQGRLLGHSVSYNHNKQIAILSAQATRELDIPGDMIFKIIEPLILFGVLGLLLLEYYPPILVLVYFLALFVCAVTFAMIGYHQYNTLLNYITLLSQKYEPSKRAINWMTAEQNLWLVKLSKAFDFMSCAFFVIGLLFAIACCGFCFHPAFGVLSNASIIRNVFFLMFWGKILWELAVKYLYKMYLGKKNLKSLADKIKENHLNMVYSQFKKTICSEEDCTGYGLYLQIQNLDILPKTETVVYMIQGIVEVADFVVTLSSLFTIFQSLQAQLI